VLASCAREPSKTVIARVGDAELTLEQALAHIDTTRGAIGFQLREYASTWTTTELLYREAQRAGIEKSPEFQQQFEDVRRQLRHRALACNCAGGINETHRCRFHESVL
jgi:hypothetical protein